MRITVAIKQAEEAGWTLFTDDTHTDWRGKEYERLICHVYVKRGDTKRRLCSWSELYHWSRATFTAKLAELPAQEEVA